MCCVFTAFHAPVSATVLSTARLNFVARAIDLAPLDLVKAKAVLFSQKLNLIAGLTVDDRAVEHSLDHVASILMPKHIYTVVELVCALECSVATPTRAYLKGS